MGLRTVGCCHCRPLRIRQFDRQPVIAGLDPAGQFGAQLAIIEALVHMGQHGAARPHPLDPGQRLRQMAMRRMRLAAQAIDDPKLDPGERGKRGLVEFGDIGRIGDRPDAKAQASC